VHAGHVGRNGDIDAMDDRVRVGASHKCDMKQAGELQIVEKAATPLNQGHVLDPLDGFADVIRAFHAM
jgi:hypothetical protein